MGPLGAAFFRIRGYRSSICQALLEVFGGSTVFSSYSAGIPVSIGIGRLSWTLLAIISSSGARKEAEWVFSLGALYSTALRHASAKGWHLRLLRLIMSCS
jgi:hypothetical protein